MAVKSGFFNSVNSDRLYNADDMSNFYGKFFTSGVFPNPSTNLQVIADGGTAGTLAVRVNAGWGIFDSRWVNNDAAMSFTLEPAHVSYNRIDSVVVRIDYESREGSIVLKTGTAAANAVPPETLRTATVKEYTLARIYVSKNNQNVISQSDITDTRPDTTICGWVTGTVPQVDTSTLFAQWQTAYEEFFADLKAWEAAQESAFSAWYATLTEDLNVGAYVTTYKRNFVNSANTYGFEIGISQYDSSCDVSVYINGFRLNGSEYSIVDIEGTPYIELEFTITAGQSIEIVVLKSEIGYNTNV